MHLKDMVGHLNELLRIEETGDYANALNGLQVENSGGISRIGAAVDACETVIQDAAAAGVDLLLVHHGLFWGGLSPMTGAAYRKMRMLIEADMAVYSAHLPLDRHPEIGNNVLLAKALGLEGGVPFFESAVSGTVHLAAGGPIVARKIGLVTGGAGGDIAKVAAVGIDTFITGEGPHWSYTAAEELEMNLFYAGHYATETFGVKALATKLSEKFALPWQFIDHPTGL